MIQTIILSIVYSPLEAIVPRLFVILVHETILLWTTFDASQSGRRPLMASKYLVLALLFSWFVDLINQNSFQLSIDCLYLLTLKHLLLEHSSQMDLLKINLSWLILSENMTQFIKRQIMKYFCTLGRKCSLLISNGSR